MACKPQTEDSTCCPGGMGSRALLRKASQQRTREVCCHALSKRRPSWSVHPFVHLAYHLRVTVGSPRSMQQRDQADTGRVVTNDHRSVILHTAYYGSQSECALFTGTLLTQHGSDVPAAPCQSSRTRSFQPPQTKGPWSSIRIPLREEVGGRLDEGRFHRLFTTHKLCEELPEKFLRVGRNVFSTCRPRIV
jgi:hypothetical protein